MVTYKFTEETEIANAPMSTGLLAKLQKDILTGRFRPGDKLTEQAICKEYEVSRTPVREALRQLEESGLVEMQLNRGAFVVGMSKQDYADLFELRKAYEVQAVRWAIERITDEEMESLEETFEFMEFYTMRNDIDKMLIINAGFHQVIYEAAHNRMLQKTLTSYQTFLKYRDVGRVYESNYLTTVLDEHRAIFKAFIDRDVQAGAEAMERHIDLARARRISEGEQEKMIQGGEL